MNGIKIFCTWAVLTIALTASAQENRRLSNEIRSNMLQAYNYRSDIDKSVLATTKKWPDKYGILHHDWIENCHGRSITLTGEEILPQYDYTELNRYNDSLYVMKVGSRRGVVTRSGRQVVPFQYWKISFRCISDGLILGLQNSAGTGKVDVYSIQGHLVCQLDNVQEMDASYYSHANMVSIDYKRTGAAEVQELLFFPDGTPYSSDSSAVAAHPSIPPSYWFDSNEIDGLTFNSNIWVKKFWEYYNQGKYRDALYCISFYDSEDRQALRSDASIPNFITFTSILDCYKHLGMDEALVRTIQATTIDHRLPRGLLFNVETRRVESTLDLLYSGMDQENLLGMVNDMNKLYVSALPGYQAQVAQRQQTAQMWMAAMSAGVQTLTTSLIKLAEADEARRSQPAKGRSKASGGGNSSSSASSSSSDDEEKEDEPRKPRDTSRIDRRIQELEESLRSAEIREAKEHDGATFRHIQSLKQNIKDLKEYRKEFLKD